MNYLNQNWWNNVLEQTNQLRQPAVFKSAFPDQVTDLTKLSVDVLRELMMAKGLSAGFRIWVADENNVISQKPTKEYDQLMHENPPLADEAIADWAKRLFGDRRFGIVLNDGEMYSAEMNRRLAVLIRPLLDIMGMPLTGVTTAYFVGNYGYTPFGIHQDLVGENVFHFHLGPGPKTMYTWTDELYKEISGVSNNPPTPELLAQAEKFEFGAGDLYYMPWNRYHVGHTEELSIGVTVWLNNPTPATFLRKIARTILGEITPVRDAEIMKKTVLSPDKGLPGDLTVFEEIGPFVKLDDSMADLSLQEFMHVSVENYRLSLFSNSGFTLLQAPAQLPWELLRGQHVRLVQPFRMYYTRFKAKLYLFIRGYKIELKHHPELPALIDALNTGGAYPVEDLIQPLLTEWSENVGLQIVNILLNHRAIEAVDDLLVVQAAPALLAEAVPA